MTQTSLMEAKAALGEAIAKSAASYDALPYISNPFPQTHPARTAAIAGLFGLRSPPIDTMRVLEIGCSSAGNIIPMAARFPNARFIGIDISQKQIDEGSERIARLGLTNIELRCISVTDFGSASGKFDFIICHGVYSWVPEAVRHAILDVCRDRLSGNGIAYISYNVLPGWRMLQAVRDAVQLASPKDAPLLERVAKGKQFLDFLAAQTREDSIWGKTFRSEAQRLARLPEDYIGHEFLEDVNEPCTFGEFFQDAAARNLAYLAEADVPTMLPESLGAEVGAEVRRACGNDMLAVERHMDVVAGRTFRQTLLVHADRAKDINRTLDFDRIRALHFVAGQDLRFQDDPSKGFVYSDGMGRTLTTSSLETRDAIQTLMDRRPATSSLPDLVPAGADEVCRNTVLDALFKMLMVGLIRVHAVPIHAKSMHAASILAASSGQGHPMTCRMVASDAAARMGSVTNLLHDRIEPGVVAMRILPLLDGETSIKRLEASVLEAVDKGTIVFLREDAPITSSDALAEAAKEHVMVAINQLSNCALLTERVSTQSNSGSRNDAMSGKNRIKQQRIERN